MAEGCELSRWSRGPLRRKDASFPYRRQESPRFFVVPGSASSSPGPPASVSTGAGRESIRSSSLISKILALEKSGSSFINGVALEVWLVVHPAGLPFFDLQFLLYLPFLSLILKGSCCPTGVVPVVSVKVSRVTEEEGENCIKSSDVVPTCLYPDPKCNESRSIKSLN